MLSSSNFCSENFLNRKDSRLNTWCHKSKLKKLGGNNNLRSMKMAFAKTNQRKDYLSSPQISWKCSNVSQLMILL